jgi:hypothetical protein
LVQAISCFFTPFFLSFVFSLCSGFLCCFWVYASVRFFGHLVFSPRPCVCSLWFPPWFFVIFFPRLFSVLTSVWLFSGL